MTACTAEQTERHKNEESREHQEEAVQLNRFPQRQWKGIGVRYKDGCSTIEIGSDGPNSLVQACARYASVK